MKYRMIATAMSLALSVVPLRVSLDMVDRGALTEDEYDIAYGKNMSIKGHQNEDYHGNKMSIDDYLDWLEEELDALEDEEDEMSLEEFEDEGLYEDDYDDSSEEKADDKSKADEVKDKEKSSVEVSGSPSCPSGTCSQADTDNSCQSGECYDYSYLFGSNDYSTCSGGSCGYYDDDWDDDYDDWDDDYDDWDDDYDDDWYDDDDHDDWDGDYDYWDYDDYDDYDDWDDDYDDDWSGGNGSWGGYDDWW